MELQAIVKLQFIVNDNHNVPMGTAESVAGWPRRLSAPGFYAGRASGGHHDHRDSDRALAACGPSGEGGGEASPVANNLKQLGLACLNLEQTQKHLPAGGVGFLFVGDPNLPPDRN